ncbi:hypothetical protein BGX38DRAFT_1208987 [Terfezia claveryi]|nr:hypothetical protein BGX38DRAFT_1208987 [Terfezia claveryi]
MLDGPSRLMTHIKPINMTVTITAPIPVHPACPTRRLALPLLSGLFSSLVLLVLVVFLILTGTSGAFCGLSSSSSSSVESPPLSSSSPSSSSPFPVFVSVFELVLARIGPVSLIPPTISFFSLLLPPI